MLSALSGPRAFSVVRPPSAYKRSCLLLILSDVDLLILSEVDLLILSDVDLLMVHGRWKQVLC